MRRREKAWEGAPAVLAVRAQRAVAAPSVGCRGDTGEIQPRCRGDAVRAQRAVAALRRLAAQHGAVRDHEDVGAVEPLVEVRVRRAVGGQDALHVPVHSTLTARAHLYERGARRWACSVGEARTPALLLNRWSAIRMQSSMGVLISMQSACNWCAISALLRLLAESLERERGRVLNVVAARGPTAAAANAPAPTAAASAPAAASSAPAAAAASANSRAGIRAGVVLTAAGIPGGPLRVTRRLRARPLAHVVPLVHLCTHRIGVGVRVAGVSVRRHVAAPVLCLGRTCTLQKRRGDGVSYACHPYALH